jgi:hypothetical protein
MIIKEWESRITFDLQRDVDSVNTEKRNIDVVRLVG